MNFIAASPQKCESTEKRFLCFFRCQRCVPEAEIYVPVFIVMKGGGAYENYPYCIFHGFSHIKQIHKQPPPLRNRQTHTEKRRAEPLTIVIRKS